MNLYEFEVKDIKGNMVSMEEYRGKVLLIVNTATGCGFTPQYEGLQHLYEKYQDKGFEVLDFPCNQFANEAPGTDNEIKSFCTLKYGVSFPMFSKIKVNGKGEEPLYNYLKTQKKGVVNSNIKWNFTKFLVDRNGEVFERFAPAVEPKKIDAKIALLL